MSTLAYPSISRGAQRPDEVAENAPESPDQSDRPHAPTLGGGRLIRGHARQRLLHFTFDDGPRPSTTRPVLDHLERAGVRATFFVVARQLHGNSRAARGRVALVREMLRRGHRVGFHGLDHSAFTSLTDAQLNAQYAAGERIFEQKLGMRPFLVRPPYGRRDARTDRIATSRGYTQVLWGITAADTSQNRTQGVVSAFRRALDNRQNGRRLRGGVILLHDTHRWVVDALPAMLQEVERRNCALLATDEPLWDVTPDLTPFFHARGDNEHSSTLAPIGGYDDATFTARQNALREAASARCTEPDSRSGAAPHAS